ncbi:futalosine hydrolase [Chitinophaga sp. sic0106]|uniref:futalosine hydrolase n=1 Tax=Chitinophaga sp. sic0106 TaxID=2854785 RepID=UPI001C450D5F|nr:futalosine hydrolase [Chitinophaga sp. sic0106]MBV7533277.1 futalosine hydrolase [Chitinophaga sp. sic0106]
MKILVTAATSLEIKPFLQYLEQHSQQVSDYRFRLTGCEVDVLIAGIGMMHTAFSLGKYLTLHTPHVAIQAGICGTFRKDWHLGAVVAVEREHLADLGAEDNDQFKDLFDISLWKESQHPFTGTSLVNTFHAWPLTQDLPAASGVSVNRVSGSAPTIALLEAKYQPDTESMEGAAFHYACLQENIPFLQIRSISNYVEIRDKSKWQIPTAVKNLNDELVRTVEQLCAHYTTAIKNF